MFKRIGNSLLSVILVLTLLLPTLALSMTAQATVVKEEPVYGDLYFVVPESIYLKPANNAYSASGTYDFQLYVNNTLNTGDTTVTADRNESTTGKIYFMYPNADSAKISFRWHSTPGIEISSTSCIRYGDGSDKAPSTGEYILGLTGGYGSTTITGGKSPIMESSTSGDYICWVATYTDNADGQQKQAYAYTYVYKPYAAPIAVGQKSENTRGNNHYGSSISWLSGIHDVAEERDQYPRTDTSSGLLPFANSVPADNPVMHETSLVDDNLYFQMPSYFRCTGFSNLSPAEWFSTSATDAPKKSGHFVGFDSDAHSSGNDYTMNFAYSATGSITVDNSRYNNLAQVPNLTVGVMVTDDEKSDSNASYFVANRTAHTPAYTQDHADYWHTSDGTDYEYWNTYYNDDPIAVMGNYNNQTGYESEGVKIHKRWWRTITSAETSSTFYLGTGYANHQGGDLILNVAELRCYINMYNKAALREAMVYAMKTLSVNNIALLGAGAASWTQFYSLYCAVAKELCKVNGTWVNTMAAGTTYSNPTALANALKAKADEVKSMNNADRKRNNAAQYNVRVYDDGGVWKLSPHSGITSASTDQFTVGAKVTYTANEIPGYTCIGYRTKQETTTSGGTATVGQLGGANPVTRFTNNNTTYTVPHANGNVKVSYYYLRDTYTMTFIANNGSEVPQMTYHIESEDVLPATTRPGYSFAGWIPTTSVGTWTSGTVYAAGTPLAGKTGSVSLRAKWDVVGYTVTLNANGGEVSPETIEYDTLSSVTLPTPTRDGYVFGGWASRDDAEGSWDANTVYAAGTALAGKYGNVTLEALWIAKPSFKITFVGNGATSGSMGAMDVVQGSTVTLPSAAFTRTLTVTYDGNGGDVEWTSDSVSAVFTGWNTAPDGSGTAYADADTFTYTINGSITLYAQWDAAGAVELPGAAREEFLFDGWYTAPAAGVLVGAAGDTVLPTQSMTLYAHWERKGYTIVFLSNGGSDVAPITALFGESITPPENPTREGYTFVKWVLDDDETQSEYIIPDSMPAQNIYLIACWRINSYTITFDSDGGTKVDPITADYNATITAPAVPTKVGCTFNKWVRADDETQTKYVFRRMPAEDFTLKAIWTPKRYYVTYMNEGEEFFRIRADFGSTIEVPDLPEKPGYNFVGWEWEQDDGSVILFDHVVPADDITVQASWSPITYKVYFFNGSLAYSVIENCEYDTAFTLTSAPHRDGYDFAGWALEENGEAVYGDRETVVNLTATDCATVSLYAVWTKRQYSISFDGNGATSGSMSALETVFGSTVDLPANAFGKAYTVSFDGAGGTPAETAVQSACNFLKWNTKADGSGDDYLDRQPFGFYQYDDVTLYAQWDAAGAVGLPDAVREGFRFDGWYTAPAAGVRVGDAGDTVLPTQSMTLYAHWTADTPVGERLTYAMTTAQGRAGDRVTLSVEIKNNTGIIASRLSLSYDKTKLRLVEVTNGTVFSADTFTAGDNLEKVPFVTHWVDGVATQNVTANGTLVTYTFEILPDAAAGVTPVTIEVSNVFDFDMQSVAFAVENGAVNIRDCLVGDAQGDGEVDLRDVVWLLRYLAGWNVEVDEFAADVNGDGAVDLRDVTIIRRYLAEWEGYERYFLQNNN